MAEKLHKQFGHPSFQKLISLVKNAGVDNRNLEEALEKYSNNCDTCKKFSRPKPRPVVSLPMATKFNETVSMDLKSYRDGYFLVMVDLATRFCAAAFVRNKLPSTIIRNIFTSWISLFGPPSKFLSDNGCEFNNSEMRELGEKFNIKVLTTSAESPWSNGVCERLNGVLGDSVEKIVHDSSCDVNIALAWAVSARNALANNHGFAPNQLVFGSNPVFPNVHINQPPANESSSVSKMVSHNLSAMHSAREDFIQKESCERLQRAMRHNVRATHVENLQNGDQVYYKRNDSNEWRGPGVVIGRDGKQVLVKHRGVYVRVHICRLVHTPIACNEPRLTPSVESRNSVAVEGYLNEDSDTDDDADEIPDQPNATTASGTINSEAPINSREESTNSSEASASNIQATENNREETTTADVTADSAGTSSCGEPARATAAQRCVSTSTGSGARNLKIGERVSGIHLGSGELVTGKIVSRAGKVTGRNKNCYNIQRDSDNNVQWYDLVKDFHELTIIPDEAELLVLFNSDAVMAAKECEILNWRENDVFEEVENDGQNALSVRWVVTEKIKGGKPVTKARLVARGFEEETSNLRKDSPTCSKEAVRLVLALSSSQSWECHSLDVKAAYLQGNTINRDVFLMPPAEYYTGRLWKLKKTVYGLCDAARAWYLRVKEELLNLGAKVCSLDSALFTFASNNVLQGVVCVYVDDFLWAGDEYFEKKVIKKLSDLFLIGSAESGAFKYVGLNVDYKDENATILVDQIQYAASLRQVGISRQRANQKASDLSDGEKSEYRSLVGQLNWIATHTRPDIAFDVCELSVAYSGATVGDLIRLNKVVERVRTDSLKLQFEKMKSVEECYLECYSDASFANLPGSGSQGGFIIFLRDHSGARCPLYWQSRKIRRVVKSTLSAEALALLDCAEAAVYISAVLAELTFSQHKINVRCYIDNKSLLDALYSSKRIEDRRLRIDLAVLQDMLDRGELTSVAWVATSMQLADCLTKRGASTISLRDAISA